MPDFLRNDQALWAVLLILIAKAKVFLRCCGVVALIFSILNVITWSDIFCFKESNSALLGGVCLNFSERKEFVHAADGSYAANLAGR